MAENLSERLRTVVDAATKPLQRVIDWVKQDPTEVLALTNEPPTFLARKEITPSSSRFSSTLPKFLDIKEQNEKRVN